MLLQIITICISVNVKFWWGTGVNEKGMEWCVIRDKYVASAGGDV